MMKNWRNARTPYLGSKIIGDIVMLLCIVFTAEYIGWWSPLFGLIMGFVANIITDNEDGGDE
jgi:hypothetical protein